VGAARRARHRHPVRPGERPLRLVDGLEPAAGEPTLTKTSRNAFTTTNLQQILTEQGIRELVICGIQTEQCCETTARVGADLGFDVTFVTEATATFPIPHRSGFGELGVEDIIERTEYALAGRFATISTIAELAVG
jgi:nicotinamidase-related amidase